jgi:putative selenate reductase
VAHLAPYPLGALARRMFRELERREAIFDLPAHKFVLGEPFLDLAVRHHGRSAATPLGPAAGPNTQLAQNILLSWLGGGRILELKTVQVRDDLVIPRPCIDMETVGYNVEWSQELRLEESLEEYVKGAMLIRMLLSSGRIPFAAGMDRTLFDMSVGYDLAGIRSERVRAFLHGMRNAAPVVDRLRGELTGELAGLRDLPYEADLSQSVTLSTFHGCPPDEIERIVEFLLREERLSCVIKLNPTLLGPDEARGLLHEALGYTELRVPDAAFAKDTTWEQAVGFVGRLGELARSLGLGLGVKFTNTLIVENHRQFFPAAEREMYLSGPPLHVLAMHLVRRFRREFGARFPISFSAGIVRHNFPDAVALGLVPVTVCTDLLKPGGYARPAGYFEELGRRMGAVDARSVDQFVARAYERDPAVSDRESPADLAAAVTRNTERYVERLTGDERYHAGSHRRPPRKIGRRLRLFDCISCDKCVPVCPNDANFTFVLERAPIPRVRLRRAGALWTAQHEGEIEITEPHQIGNFADFCNDCGNCDVFCPEDGGPYNLKPRLFVSAERWAADCSRDGLCLERRGARAVVLGRFEGAEYRLETGEARAAFSGPGFRVSFDERDPEGTVQGEADSEVDLTYYHIMTRLRQALLAPDTVNYVNAYW